MLPQRRRIGRRSPGLRHHVGHKTQRAAARRSVAVERMILPGIILPGIRTAIAARHHGGLSNILVPQQRRLDLARLDAEAAQLHLRIGAAEEVEHAVLTPARQVAGAVHPAARRPERIGHEPLGRQPRTPQIAPRQARARNIKLARHTRRNRLQPTVEHVDPRVPDRPADRNRRQRRVRQIVVSGDRPRCRSKSSFRSDRRD